jgi:hypothetical protein
MNCAGTSVPCARPGWWFPNEDIQERRTLVAADRAGGRAAAVAAGGDAVQHPRVHLPQPLAIATQFIEFKGPLLEAAWKTFWVTMLGFAVSIVVGVLLGFLIGSSRLAYTALYPLMVGFNAVPKAAVVPILVVWFGIGLGPGILTAFLISVLPHHREHRHRAGDAGTRAGRRAARAGRQALGRADQGRPATLDAVLLRQR